MGSSFAKATTAAIPKSPVHASAARARMPSALLSRPLVGQLLSTVRTVVTTVKERGGGTILLDRQDVEPIEKLLDQVYPEQLGMVVPLHPHIRPRTDFPSDIRYINICEEPDWHVGIFVLPPGGRIPLHDHPGMCVLSRLLCGSLHVKSFDWCSPRGVRGLRLAKLHRNQWLHEPRTLTLFSQADNVHEFVAGDDGCAILDVLVPPYDPYHGRPCNYYKAVSVDTSSRQQQPDAASGGSAGEEGVFRLVEVEEPEDLEVVNGEYEGPSPEGKGKGPEEEDGR